MDMQTLDMEIFLRSLTTEQMDVCESDEKKLGKIFNEGWSAETAVRFHRAMICARRITPEATVEGVFETALRVGLSALCDETLTRKQKREDDAPPKKRKRAGVRGL